VEAAPFEAAPSAHFYGNAVGGVAGGDLFYINAAGSQADVFATIYLTNANELFHYFKYLILKIGIFTEDGAGNWQRMATPEGTEMSTAYISLKDGEASLILPGMAKYKITIESGSYRCLPFNGGTGNIAPQFYLTTEST
jgi:hypothetical protein